MKIIIIIQYQKHKWRATDGMRNQMDKMYEMERGGLLNSLIDGSSILKGVKS